MDEVYKFLKENPIFYVATMDGDQPRVRPFGVVALFEGKALPPDRQREARLQADDGEPEDRALHDGQGRNLVAARRSGSRARP